MFFSRPRLDVDEERRAWAERSLQRLIDLFGREYFLKRPVVLPTPQFFPDRYPPTGEGLGNLVRRVSGYMDVDFDRLEYHLYTRHDIDELKKHLPSWEGKGSGASGLYFGQDAESGKFHIAIETKNLREPMTLVATVAHELAHVRLLGEGRISREEEDHEPLTDLTTVFMGMGIFPANAAFQFGQWSDNTHQGWQSSRLGYLSQSMFGYTLAACAWMRRDEKAPWSAHLSANVRDMFKKTMKYLTRGGDTLLTR